MKKFEAKTTLLLALPALALVGFASILSLHNTKHDFGPPYRIVEHEVVTERRMTAKQKEFARICHIPLGHAVCYRYTVEGHQARWWDALVLGDKSTNVQINGSSCVELKTKMGIMPEYSGGAGEWKGMRDIYDRRLLNNGDVVFSFPLTWSDGTTTHTFKITKRVSPQTLK